MQRTFPSVYQLTAAPAHQPCSGQQGDVYFLAHEGQRDFLYRVGQLETEPRKIDPEPITDFRGVSPAWRLVAYRLYAAPSAFTTGRVASSDATCLRLRQIPGIGPLIATAIVRPMSRMRGGADHNPSGKAPVNVFVLDLLNSRFEDFAYIRHSMRKYLDAQPAELTSPAELMVLGNKSLEMVQGYTRSKVDLLYALDHIPAELPYKMMNGSFYAERFGQSIDALQQIALQNKGIPGRKNVVWVGARRL